MKFLPITEHSEERRFTKDSASLLFNVFFPSKENLDQFDNWFIPEHSFVMINILAL